MGRFNEMNYRFEHHPLLPHLISLTNKLLQTSFFKCAVSIYIYIEKVGFLFFNCEMQQKIFFQSEHYFYADPHEHDFLSGSIKSDKIVSFSFGLTPTKHNKN